MNWRRNKKNYFKKEAVFLTIIVTFLICSLSTAIPITNNIIINENINNNFLNQNIFKNMVIENINDLSPEYNKVILDYLGIYQNERISINKILCNKVIPLSLEIQEIIKYKKTFDDISSGLKNLITSVIKLNENIDKDLVINNNLADFSIYWTRFEEHLMFLDRLDANDMDQITDAELEWNQDFRKDIFINLFLASVLVIIGSIVGIAPIIIGPVIAGIGLTLFAYVLFEIYNFLGCHWTMNYMEYWRIDMVLQVTDPHYNGVSDLSNYIIAYSKDVNDHHSNYIDIFTYNFGPMDEVEYIDENKREGWYILSNWYKERPEYKEYNKPPPPPGYWKIKFNHNNTKYIFPNDEITIPLLESRDVYLFNISYPEIDTNPKTPSIIETVPPGIVDFNRNVVYTFETNTYDPEGQLLYFRFDWGDGEVSPWSTSGVISGERCSNSHKWEESGCYEIKVQARDGSLQESWWSLPLKILVI